MGQSAFRLISYELRREAALMSRRLLLDPPVSETRLSGTGEYALKDSKPLLAQAVSSARLRDSADVDRDPFRLHLLPYGFRREGGETLMAAITCAELVAAIECGEASIEDEAVVEQIKESLDALRETVAVASITGLPMPVMATALHTLLLQAYREETEA